MLAGIVDLITRGIRNANLTPKVKLLARVGNSVIHRFRPVDKLRLRAVAKRGLHDVIIHKCAGKRLEPAGSDGAAEGFNGPCANVGRAEIDVIPPESGRKRATHCGTILRGEILTRAIVD